MYTTSFFESMPCPILIFLRRFIRVQSHRRAHTLDRCPTHHLINKPHASVRSHDDIPIPALSPIRRTTARSAYPPSHRPAESHARVAELHVADDRVPGHNRMLAISKCTTCMCLTSAWLHARHAAHRDCTVVLSIGILAGIAKSG
jgi:hypothetical protein